MGPIILRLSMQYTIRYCLLHISTLSRTTFVLYKNKFCLVLFHCHIFCLTNFATFPSLINLCITCIQVNQVLSSPACMNKSYLYVKDCPLKCRLIRYCNTLIKKLLVHCSKADNSIFNNNHIYTLYCFQFQTIF